MDETRIARLGKVFSSNSYDFSKVTLPKKILSSIKVSRSKHEREQNMDRNWQIYYKVCFKYFIKDNYINTRDEYWLHKLRFCRKAFKGLSQPEIKEMFLEAKEFMFHSILDLNIKHAGDKKAKESK